MAREKRDKGVARWALLGMTGVAAGMVWGLVVTSPASAGPAPLFDPSTQQLQQPAVDNGPGFSPRFRTRAS